MGMFAGLLFMAPLIGAALGAAAGGIWAKAAREGALGRLRAMGLPERRDEYWKYTRPDTLVQADAPPAAIFAPEEVPMFDAVDRLKIVFVDGEFDAEASDDLNLEGITIERLSEAAQIDIHWAKDVYGVLEERGQDPVQRSLATLNTAVAQDGMLLHVTGRVSKPINLIYHHRSVTSDATLHHVIKLEKGADVTILENGPAAARFNKVMEVDVADGNNLISFGSIVDSRTRTVPLIFAYIVSFMLIENLFADRSLSRLLKRDWPKTVDELEKILPGRAK